MQIGAETMMEAWKKAVTVIITDGRAYNDDNKRACRELANLVVTIHRPSTAVEGVRAMKASRKWLYPSEEELANIMLHKEASPIYDYLYGQRLFAYENTVNQVDEYVIPLLQQHPQTRRATISLVNPKKDLHLETRNVLGLALIHCRIVKNKLELTAIIRTSGFFTGWPANVYQLSKLQEYIARALSLTPGKITTVSLSAHLYVDQLDDIETVLGSSVVAGAARE